MAIDSPRSASESAGPRAHWRVLGGSRASVQPDLRSRWEIALLGGLMLVGLGARVWLLVASGEFSADEAVPGLMGRHIVSLGELPVFYWGQDYFGAAEAYLIAALFALFGFWPWLVFVPALVASSALIPLTYILGNELGPKPAGLIASIPIALAPPVLARGLVSSGGGFSLSFALVCCALICVLRAHCGGRGSIRWVALFTLCAGFAFWIWQPALIALPPLLGVLLLRIPPLRHPMRLLMTVAPVAIGLAPPLVYNAQHGWPTVSALVRKSGETPLAGGDLAGQLHTFGSLTLLALGGGDDSIGGANPVQSTLLAACLLIAPVTIELLALRSSDRHWRTRVAASRLMLLTTVMITLAAYQSARYLMPVVVTAAALLGVIPAVIGVRVRYGPAVAIGGALVVIGIGNLRLYPQGAELLATPGLASTVDTRAALAALDQRGLKTGYADYWAAYPITFLSGEQIVVAPGLPFFWRARTDRYPPYSHQVDAVDQPRQLFALVDRRCALEPYLEPLDTAGATYRVEAVARWSLVWDLQTPPGMESRTLMAWRSAIYQSTC